MNFIVFLNLTLESQQIRKEIFILTIILRDFMCKMNMVNHRELMVTY